MPTELFQLGLLSHCPKCRVARGKLCRTTSNRRPMETRHHKARYTKAKSFKEYGYEVRQIKTTFKGFANHQLHIPLPAEMQAPVEAMLYFKPTNQDGRYTLLRVFSRGVTPNFGPTNEWTDQPTCGMSVQKGSVTSIEKALDVISVAISYALIQYRSQHATPVRSYVTQMKRRLRRLNVQTGMHGDDPELWSA